MQTGAAQFFRAPPCAVAGKATVGVQALTAAERRVAVLAAQGLTNPQIAERLVVSRYTVQTHVAHALTKLGLSSRVQLAAAMCGGLADPVKNSLT